MEQDLLALGLVKIMLPHKVWNWYIGLWITGAYRLTWKTIKHLGSVGHHDGQ